MKRQFSLVASLILVVVMVFALASCETIKNFLPDFGGNDEHVHSFENGKCSCGETDPDYVPECAEHAYSFEVTTEATCEADGVKTFTCTVCGYSYEQAVPATGHNLEVVADSVQAPTCTEAGSQTEKCTKCDYSETKELAATGHTEEEIPMQAPTCTEPGLSAGKKCSVCGTVITAQGTINPSGHKFVDGFCTNTGCQALDPDYTGSRTYLFETNTVVIYNEDGTQNATDKAEIPASNYVYGYFTIGGTVTQRVKEGSVYCIELGKEDKGYIEFTVSGTASVEILFHSTSKDNTSWIGLRDADGNLVANNENVDRVVGTGDGLLVTYNLKAGTYRVVCPLVLEETGEVDEDGNPILKNPYSRTVRVYSVKVTDTPVVEEPKNEIKVETTDTYTMYNLDFFTFTATAEGYYTFKIPAGLGVLRDGANAPEIDYYDNANGAEFTIGLEAEQEVMFWVSATTKDMWTIEWSFEAGEVDSDTPVVPPVDNNPVLSVGPNTVVVDDAHVNDGVDYTFTAEVDGTYTFGGDLLAIVFDAAGTQLGRGQVSLTAGTYTVKLVSLMGAGTYTVNVSVETAGEAGEPDGSEEYPYIWETLPESVTFVSDNNNLIYYVFTATADGSVTFTWAVEGNDWFNYFELVDGMTTENSGSGFEKTSHSFVVEAGKTYRVGLGTWNEGGETVVSIAFVACAHEWSEATCQTLSTCAKCGATTGDYADHIPNSENPTCGDPAECTVCGTEVGYIPHSWDDGVVTQQPDCSTETNGSMLLTCTVCGATQEEDIWVFHDWVVDEEIPVTCTTDGYYKAHCSVCNKIDEYTSEAQGHYNWYAACGETTTCMECGTEFTKNHEGSPATCTEPMYCYNCWQYIGEALGHTEGDAATCTTAQICTVCEAELVAALGHSYAEGYCGNCGGVDPDYYFVVSIPEALAAEDGWKVEVSGTVCAINTAWSDSYGNISVTITDADGNELYLYRLATNVALGDIITVKGAMATYNSNRQVAAGATATIDGHDSSYDYVEMSIVDAIKADDNTNVIVTGTVVKINTAYSSYYNNISITIADDNGNQLYIYRMAGGSDLALNDIITIKGAMATYSGSRQITGGTYTDTGADHTCSVYSDATCTKLSACVVCGATTGELASHNYVDGACSVCGAECPHTDVAAGEICDVCGITVPAESEGGDVEVTTATATLTPNVTESINSFASGADITSYTSLAGSEIFTLTVGDPTASYSNQVYLHKDGEIRLYSDSSCVGNTITITSTKKIVSIAITYSATSRSGATFTIGGTTVAGGTEITEETVTVNANSVTIANNKASGQVRITSIVITYEE